MYVATKRGQVENFIPELGITTLEEYFNWLVDLKEISIEETENEEDSENKNLAPSIYTILPLDEPYFEIKANTRAIRVPDEFKKNGIAVQNDDLAEVVYFKIDRYFDAIDLNNCDIYIQWETPKQANGQIKKFASTEYIRDIESDPGKLIFGWVITKDITPAAGNLKFSVRFVQWETDSEGNRKMAYSFNTLVAQVPINQGLSVGLENIKPEDIDNANDRLLDRITESTVVGSIQAQLPYFVEDII